MDKMVNMFSDLREMSCNVLSTIIGQYGSPDKDENIVLDMKAEAVIHTFYGLAGIKSLMIRTNYEGTGKGEPEVQIKGIDEDKETQIYTVNNLPIEGCIELIDLLALQFELDEVRKLLMELR